MLAFITGSGLYGHNDLNEKIVSTPFGEVIVLKGTLGNREVLMLSRHGKGHNVLPHQLNHRAQLFALKEAGATAVISCSVCGILNSDIPLGSPLIAEDLYYPDNRLGDGSACSFFQTPGESGRGHLLAGSLFHSELTAAVSACTGNAHRGVYGHVLGPRFNSKVEITALRQAGVDFISQTCGPEAVLANELELPYALTAFGIDYGNGVTSTPTPLETLQSNLEKSAQWFMKLIEEIEVDSDKMSFENFIYRFN